MGLLDDAIRDHIDLLRRRGADPTDIARAEAEALGPVVREVEEPQHHAEGEGILAGTEPAPAPEPEETDDSDAGGVPFEDEPLAADAEDSGDAGEDEELTVVAVDEPIVEQQTEHFDIFADEGVDAEADVVIEEEDLNDPALHSVDADEPPSSQAAAADADDGDDGDILEGTPDFLEESPEHDRLWFEQAPSKDFDFGDDK